MTDIVDRATRSRMMAAVPTRDTSIEMKVRRALHQRGVRYLVHRRDLPGTPDLALLKLKLAVFVHGCFWHGHGCKKSRSPSSNQAYWLNKIIENQKRDKGKIAQLKSMGWRSEVIWECEIDSGIAHLLDELTGDVGKT